MKNRKLISIVMPAFNEAGNIATSISRAQQLSNLADIYEIIVVNDGSTDKTGQIVDEISKKNKIVKVINHKSNIGYGAAVYDGLKSAGGELIFFTDSDLQFDLGQLKSFLEYIGQYDAVIGYRKNRAEGIVRKLNMVCWGSLIRLVLGLKVKDVDCAFKLFKKEVIEDIAVHSKGAMFSSELMYQVAKKGFKIYELPVRHFSRLKGRPTGSNPMVIIRAFRELIRFKKKNLRLS